MEFKAQTALHDVPNQNVMFNSRKSITIRGFILSLLFAGMAASCNTDGPVDPMKQIEERTDIVITGDLSLSEFNISHGNDKDNDLVRFNYYGETAPQIDFVIQLPSGYTLALQVIDAENGHPWMQVDHPYTVYPQEVLEDKLRYVIAEVRTGDDQPAYATNLDENIPSGISIDAFRITDNDGIRIQARIRDLKLFKNVDPDKTIVINGTFIGALDF